MEQLLLDLDEDNTFSDDFFQDLNEVCTKHAQHHAIDYETGEGGQIRITIICVGEDYD